MQDGFELCERGTAAAAESWLVGRESPSAVYNAVSAEITSEVVGYEKKQQKQARTTE